MPEQLKKDEEELTFDVDTNVTEETNGEVLENKPVVREYEKLLFQDASRLKGVKALKLVKMGCFEQYKKSKNEIEFLKLRKLDGAKVYKDHVLYERIEDNAFFYIQAINEVTKSGEERIYQYDVIEVDMVDDVTFEKLAKAHSHELNLLPNICLIVAMVFACWGLFGIISGIIYYAGEGESFINTMGKDIATAVIEFSVALSALCAAIIIKKNYEEK